jgi:DNA-binding transcriptional ArsR family regulator
MSTPRIDDELWSALGDPTRRQLLDLLLAGGPHTSTSLSERLPVTRQAVAKHLAVLDRAGLVRSAEVGRERRFEIDERRLARAAAQLQAVGATWDARLSRIKRLAETLQQTQK